MSGAHFLVHARDGIRAIRWLPAVAILILGCRGDHAAAIEAKCDASLRLRIEAMAKAEADSALEVLGRTAGAIDESRRRKLEGAGARLGQVTDDLFTARIGVRKIGHLAALDFVSSLALSQTREPLGP